MNKAEKAKELFMQGANCAQAVFGAFAEECGLTQEEAFRIASGFGAGLARMREVCGTVSGMTLVANYLRGNGNITDKAAKDAHYDLVQKMAEAFKAETGSIVCRVLLGLPSDCPQSPVSENRTPQFYRKRPCAELCALSASIAEKFLLEK